MYKIAGSHHHSRASIADFISPDNGFRGLQRRQGIEPKDHMRENRLTLKMSQMKMREEREAAASQPKELYKLQQFRDIKPRLYNTSSAAPSSAGDAPSSSRGRVSSSAYSGGGDDYGDEEVGEEGQQQQQYDSHFGDENDFNNNLSRSGSSQFVKKGVDAKRREELAKMRHAARAELQLKMEDARWVADRPLTPRKAAVPKSNEVASLAPRSNADFISRNRAKALCLVPPSLKLKDGAEPELHEDFGKVPTYLEERKAKWAEEKEEVRKRAPDPNCPKGMTLMPEAERVSTLEVLRVSKDEATKLLAKMPFVIETPSLKKRHSDLEAKLREIENAIALFSKSKVYIALDR